jgi:hypothetical protein
LAVEHETHAQSLGLRCEYGSPIAERYNRSIRELDLETPDPITERALANYARAPIPAGARFGLPHHRALTFAGVGGLPNGLWTADKNNFAPRVGIAYQFNSKTVVRAGYGIFYDVLGVDREE